VRMVDGWFRGAGGGRGGRARSGAGELRPWWRQRPGRGQGGEDGGAAGELGFVGAMWPPRRGRRSRGRRGVFLRKLLCEVCARNSQVLHSHALATPFFTEMLYYTRVFLLDRYPIFFSSDPWRGRDGAIRFGDPLARGTFLPPLRRRRQQRVPTDLCRPETTAVTARNPTSGTVPTNLCFGTRGRRGFFFHLRCCKFAPVEDRTQAVRVPTGVLNQPV